MPERARGFKGNKQALPRKDCVVCGRVMVWRKAWARSWDDVSVCSDACRAQRRRNKAPPPAK